MGYYSFRTILKHEWKTEYSSSQLKDLGTDISRTPKLPDNFEKVVRAFYYKFDNTSINEKYGDLIVKEIMGNRNLPRRNYSHDRYFSERIFQFIEDNHSYKSHSLLDKGLVFAFGIEHFTSPEKCKDYYYNNVKIHINDSLDTKYVLIGIEQISKYLFNKPVIKLDKKETFRLFLHSDVFKDKYPIDSDSIRIQQRLSVIETMMTRNTLNKPDE